MYRQLLPALPAEFRKMPAMSEINGAVNPEICLAGLYPGPG